MLFLFYFSFLFCRFVLNLVLKPIQFILLLTIFLGAKRIKTMLHKNISELLDLYLFNSRYKSNSNSYWFNSNTQNKCFWDTENIGLDFTSCQYFQRISGTFSWTHLRRFNCWLFLEVSEALKIPQFKFHLNLNMMQQEV